MHLTSTALVLTALPHGEHGAVVRFLTPDDGVQAGYVRGGRSRRLRPILQPGNIVEVELRARVDTQLAAATVELSQSRAGLAFDRLTAVATEWLTVVTANLLPEQQAYPRIHAALDALLAGMSAGIAASDTGAGIARYELLLLAELGFGLDLSECAATGSREELVYVSPRSSQAVSRGAGLPYAAKLLPLPALLHQDHAGTGWLGVVDALATTGWFLERNLLNGRSATLLTDRARLIEIIRSLAIAPEPSTV